MVEVFKFGGTCTATPAKLDRITKIIGDSDLPVVITCSAAAGITNKLKEILESRLSDELIISQLDALRQRHLDLLDNRFELPEMIETHLKRLERLLYGIYYTEELTERTYDLVMSFGERLIVPILEQYLQAVGMSTKIVDPEEFIITTNQHTNALVLLEETEDLIKEKVQPVVDTVDVVLVPGFYGTSTDGSVTLLGRSGTDYTGTVLAHGLDATGVTIWKDVFGFMSADPRMVEDAHTIPFLSYQEAAELAYFGAKLLHPRAASPARVKHIPIYIRHIDYLDSITCINSDLEKSDQVIKSVSHMTDLAIVKVYASVGGNTKGVLAKIAEKIRDAGGNTISVATSQTCIAFLLHELEAQAAAREIESLGKEMIDSIEISEGTALLCIVGEGLATTPGIASRVFDAVSSKGINVDLISAGASSVAYHFTVDRAELPQALQAVHHYFFGGTVDES